MNQPLLKIKELTVQFATSAGIVRAVNGIDFHLNNGETLALVGESGSGKSVTAMSILGLLPPAGKIVNGSIDFRGRIISGLSERSLRRIRGSQIGLVMQDTSGALNPVRRVGDQLAEIIRAHFGSSKAEAKSRALKLLEQVRLPGVERLFRAYPHELSGGQRQRVLIACAIAGNPELIIADEPTSALDVSIQAQIIDLLLELKQSLGISLLLITHDMGVVSELADRIAVMYAGKIVESSSVENVFRSPQHPYTRMLLQAQPRIRFEGLAHSHETNIAGSAPDPINLPGGCSFEPRCPESLEACKFPGPATHFVSESHSVSCLMRSESYEQH